MMLMADGYIEKHHADYEARTNMMRAVFIT